MAWLDTRSGAVWISILLSLGLPTHRLDWHSFSTYVPANSDHAMCDITAIVTLLTRGRGKIADRCRIVDISRRVVAGALRHLISKLLTDRPSNHQSVAAVVVETIG